MQCDDTSVIAVIVGYTVSASFSFYTHNQEKLKNIVSYNRILLSVSRKVLLTLYCMVVVRVFLAV